MAGSRGKFIAYPSALNNDGVMALKNIPAGTYTLNWVDCQTSERSTEKVVLKAAARLKKPQPLGSEVAVHLLKEPVRQLAFPMVDWERRAPKEVGMKPGVREIRQNRAYTPSGMNPSKLTLRNFYHFHPKSIGGALNVLGMDSRDEGTRKQQNKVSQAINAGWTRFAVIRNLLFHRESKRDRSASTSQEHGPNLKPSPDKSRTACLHPCKGALVNSMHVSLVAAAPIWD